MKKKLLALILATGLALSACGSSSNSDMADFDDNDVVYEQSGDLYELALGNPELSTFVAALEASDVVLRLQGTRILTVFAPTDEAFASLPDGLVEKLLKPENRDFLIRILTYHLVEGGLLSGDVVAGEIGSVEGSLLQLNDSSGVTVSGASVVQADLEASNGVIHIIDKVLVPPTVDLSKLD